MNRIVILLFILCVNLFAANRENVDVFDVIDYIKIAEDSLEIKVKTTCHRKILFDASPSGRYIDENESDIISPNKPRRYFDRILNLSLENYDKNSGSFFDEESFNIKINTTPDNLIYRMPTLKDNNLMWHVNNLLTKSNYRAFYIINHYGTNYKSTDQILRGDQLITLATPREIGFKVKYTGFIYIPKDDGELYQQLFLKLEILATLDKGFSVFTDDHAIIIAVPAYYTKSAVAP